MKYIDMVLIRDMEKGGGRMGGGGEIIYLSLHCHHQNDFCIKMSFTSTETVGLLGTGVQDSSIFTELLSSEA